MSIDEHLRHSLPTRHIEVDTEEDLQWVLRAGRRRRFLRRTVTGAAIVTFILLGALGYGFLVGPQQVDHVTGPVASDGHRMPSSESSDCRSETDCTEEAWLREKLEAANFRITGETHSAFIATGNEATFYAWITSGPEMLPQIEGYYQIGEVGGHEVYSDDIRLTWITHRGRAWVSPGPRPNHNVTLGQIRSLIYATTRGG